MAKQPKAVAIPTAEAIVAAYKETGSPPAALLDVIEGADRGDEQALTALRAVYAALPEIVRCVSSWQRAVEDAIIGGEQPGIQETFAVQANQMRRRLLGEDSTELERLLVNRIIVDFLHGLKTEHQLHRTLGRSTVSLAEADYLHRAAERGQRRLLRSAKTLAEVRRLMRPVLQVNIGDKQVNIGGDVHAGERTPAA